MSLLENGRWSRVVIHDPTVRQTLVIPLEVTQSAIVTASNVIVRHMVTTMFHPMRHTLDGKARPAQPQKDDLDVVTCLPHPFDPLNIGQAAQCAFQCKGLVRSGQAIQFFQ